MNFATEAAVTAEQDTTTKSNRIAILQREADAAHRRILKANSKAEALHALREITRLKQKQIAVAAT